MIQLRFDYHGCGVGNRSASVPQKSKQKLNSRKSFEHIVDFLNGLKKEIAVNQLLKKFGTGVLLGFGIA